MNTRLIFSSVAILFLAGCAATTQPQPAATPPPPATPTISQPLTGSGLPTTSEEAKYVAVIFTNAFLGDHSNAQLWRANIARHTTPELAKNMKTVDPNKVSTGEATSVTLYADGETSNRYDIGTTSMGTLRITTEIDPATNKWLVSGYSPAG